QRLGRLSAALRLEHALGRRRIFCELAGRADRARRKIAAAVRAAAAELRLHAIAAEGAFERADHGGGFGRQPILGPALAVRSRRKRGVILAWTMPCYPNRLRQERRGITARQAGASAPPALNLSLPAAPRSAPCRCRA